MQTEEIKFSSEEIDEIKQLQEQSGNLTYQLGSISAQLEFANREIDQLIVQKTKTINDLFELQTLSEEFTKRLQEKYGDGQLNLETGIYTKFSQ